MVRIKKLSTVSPSTVSLVEEEISSQYSQHFSFMEKKRSPENFGFGYYFGLVGGSFLSYPFGRWLLLIQVEVINSVLPLSTT